MASMSAAMFTDGLYPSSTIATSRSIGRAFATSTPLGAGGDLVMNRPLSVSIDNELKVPSVRIGSSDVGVPAIELPTESPIRATLTLTGSRVATRVEKPADGRP